MTMMWDVAAQIQGGSVAMRVEAKTEEGAVAKVMVAASEQGVAAQDVVIGFVMKHVEEEVVVAEMAAERHASEESQEMAARVVKGGELLNRLANDLLGAMYEGVPGASQLLRCVEEASALLMNGADAVARGQISE